jgi:hypothetical protein
MEVVTAPTASRIEGATGVAPSRVEHRAFER